MEARILIDLLGIELELEEVESGGGVEGWRN
jgi:hypothetical protein